MVHLSFYIQQTTEQKNVNTKRFNDGYDGIVLLGKGYIL